MVVRKWDRERGCNQEHTHRQKLNCPVKWLRELHVKNVNTTTLIGMRAERPTRFIRAERWQNNVDSAVTAVIMGL